MQEMLQESLQNDDQLLAHAAGDRATETFLNAMEATGGAKVWAGRRVRIEHGDGIMPELIARVKIFLACRRRSCRRGSPC